MNETETPSTTAQENTWEDFRFGPALPVPASMGNLFVFGLDLPELVEARLIEIPPETAEQLVYFCSFYPMLFEYFGYSRTVERICEEHIGHWQSLAVSWHASLAACCLIHQAVTEAASRLVSLFNPWKKETNGKEPFYFPMSVLLGWSLHQAAGFYLEDLADFAGDPNALVPNGQRAKESAKAVQQFFQPFFDLFPKDRSPYFAVLDLESLRELTVPPASPEMEEGEIVAGGGITEEKP